MMLLCVSQPFYKHTLWQRACQLQLNGISESHLLLLQMGAACAVGVDTDPVAITATLFNASLNGLSVPDFNGYVVDSHGKVEGAAALLEAFDLVVGNILLNPLVDLAEIISGSVRVGGLVGLSGILVEQVRKEGKTHVCIQDSITNI